MAQLLIVDDTKGLIEPFADAIRSRTRHDVHVAFELDELVDELAELPPIDLALVDLSFPYNVVPNDRGSGLDALVEINRHQSTTLLAVYSQVDASVAQLLRDAWELLPIATVIAKTSPLETQLATIDRVLRTGSAPVDPSVQPHLPARKAGRSQESFARLVPHAGHAKMWRALIESPQTPTYKVVADVTGLRLNTIKNYRSSIRYELSLHGVDDPSLGALRDFALRCRPFLAPYIDRAFDK